MEEPNKSASWRVEQDTNDDDAFCSVLLVCLGAMVVHGGKNMLLIQFFSSHENKFRSLIPEFVLEILSIAPRNETQRLEQRRGMIKCPVGKAPFHLSVEMDAFPIALPFRHFRFRVAKRNLSGGSGFTEGTLSFVSCRPGGISRS